MSVTDRRIGAQVTIAAFDGWTRFCLRHGVTRAGVIEALGVLMARDEATTIVTDEAIDLARRIDAERRLR